MGVRIDYVNKKNINLDIVYITGAGYIDYPFKGVARDSAWGWEEPVWAGSLTRSKTFVLTNIEDIAFGKVARVELNFKYMNITDYKVLQEMTFQRVLTVKYVNRQTGEYVIQEMAFTKNGIKALYGFGSSYLGVQNISINLVATNRDMVRLINTQFTVSYNNNGGSGSIASVSDTYWSDMITLSANDGDAMTKSGYHIKEWNTQSDGSGQSYGLGQNVTIWKDLTLYAIWESA